MMKRIAVCDVCGKRKGESNKWSLLLCGARGLGRVRYAVFDWSAKLARSRQVKHLCGEAFLAAFCSKNLAGRTARKRPPLPS
jgi:hypothetical protein